MRVNITVDQCERVEYLLQGLKEKGTIYEEYREDWERNCVALETMIQYAKDAHMKHKEMIAHLLDLQNQIKYLEQKEVPV